jgi:type I restriction enzyme S subunit
MVRKATGASYPAVSDRIVLESKIPLPSITEQKRIAAILDKAEELRELRRRALAQLDVIAQSIFLEMFGESVENPKNSQITSLGSHLSFLTSGGRGWAKFYSSTGRRFIRSLDVQMNYISDDEAVYVTPPDNAEARRTMVAQGDVLLTITGSRIGRVAPVPENFAGAFVSQHVAILRPNPTIIDPVFLSFFLNMQSGGQRQIAKFQYGQTKPGLNFEQINSFKIPVPAISLQKEFVRRVEVIEQLKTNHRASLAQLDALFASLQHRAFRGEL